MAKLSAGWQNAKILGSVFDQLSDALILYDANQVITGVNAAAERLFGMSAEALIGRDCHEMFRCQVCEPGCGMQTGLVQVNGHNSTVRLHTQNGMERLVIIHTSQLVRDDGTLEGAVATIKDVTEEVEPQKREIVADSALMRDLLNFVRRVALSEATTVLIEGENGTGKDLIAKTLHYQSVRQAEPFIAINCAAIPETLLESELFGYEKGAFTGAVAQKKGKLDVAEGGTVFLDEIGELAPELQAKLLRVVQQREFERVGGTRTLKLDVRLIAATNRDLNAEVRRGAFREDLYHRLNVVALHVPALRVHAEDIPALARHFLEQAAVRCRRRVSAISPEAERYMMSYSWPGNVRELENAIERAVVLGQSDVILLEDLPETILESASIPEVPGALQSSVTESKRQSIVEAWRQSNGDHNRAAARLHIHPNSLRRLIRSLHLRDMLQ